SSLRDAIPSFVVNSQLSILHYQFSIDPNAPSMQHCCIRVSYHPGRSLKSFFFEQQRKRARTVSANPLASSVYGNPSHVGHPPGHLWTAPWYIPVTLTGHFFHRNAPKQP